MERLSVQLLAPNLWFWLVLLIPALCLAIWSYYRVLAPLSRPARGLLWSLRALAFLLVLFALWQPVASFAWRDSGKPALAVLLDRSASVSLPGRDHEPRREEIRELVPQIERALSDRFRLDWYGFSDAVVPVEPDSVPLGAGPTALGSALESVLLRDDAPVDGILVVSDGVNTAGRDPVRVAAASPIPVFTVAVGPSSPPRDLEVRRVQTNPTGFAGEPIPLRVTLSSHGLAGRSARLEVREQGTLRHDQEIEILGDRGLEQELATQVVPTGSGLRVFEVSVSVEGDSVSANDMRVVAVNVLERKTRVLVASDALSWDFAFLRRAVLPDTTLEYSFLVQDRPGRWSRVGTTGAARLPASRAELAEYAAIMLVSSDRVAFPASFLDALPGYVRAGGGLFVLGAPEEASARALTSILPASSTAGGRHGDFLRVALTAEGMRHPVTALRDDPAEAASWIATLPTLWKPVGTRRASPAARTLLEFPAANGAEPALLASFVERGKIVWMPATSVWRWRLTAAGAGLPSDAGSMLFVSTARWIVEPLSRDRFRVDPARRVTPQGEAVAFSSSLWDAAYEPLSGARVSVELEPALGATPGSAGRIELTPGIDPGTYEGEGPQLPPGEYRYRARALDPSGRDLGTVEGSVWVEAMGPEFSRTWSDREALRDMAERSGGVSVDAASFADLPREIPRSLRRVTRTREVELWNHWLVFGLFVSVLATEWWLRRRRGLA